jgi:hypothetical protein
MRNPATKRPQSTEPRVGICGNTVSIHDRERGRDVFLSVDEYVRAQIEGTDVCDYGDVIFATMC